MNSRSKAQQVLDILGTGDFPQRIREAIKGTVYYPETNGTLPVAPRFVEPSTLEVWRKDTVSAALNVTGATPCILNFASAKTPGGGFLRDSRAQEEDICRSSGLHPVLCANMCKPFYAPTETWKYANRVIYSPGVPLLSGSSVNVITAAAPNLRNSKDAVPETELEVLWKDRWSKVLYVAASNNVDVLILGAWGCGVFGNPPATVIKAFLAVWPTYQNCFKRVIFSIPSHLDPKNYATFSEVLGKAGAHIP